VNREQTNAKGEKMYIQTHMAKYANEFWKLLHQTLFLGNIHVRNLHPMQVFGFKYNFIHLSLM
jgi:hypothetical protein